MDKNRVKGTIKQVEGAVKEELGNLTNDPALEVEGKVEKAAGTLQNAYGKARDALQKD